jgi:hypothetical protein
LPAERWVSSHLCGWRSANIGGHMTGPKAQVGRRLRRASTNNKAETSGRRMAALCNEQSR